jgi:hypothetical protein
VPNIDITMVLRRPMRSARCPPSDEAITWPRPYAPRARPALAVE